MTLKNRFELFRGITPAIAVFVCVCLALSAYVAPTYNLDPLPELQTPVLGLTGEEAEALAEVDEAGGYIDGVYYGSAKGYNGTIKVKVTIAESKIADIEIVSHIEDQPYLKNSVNKVIPAILDGQTTNVDAYSGATFTSNGIILAVRDALSQAGGVAEEFEPLKEAVREPEKKGEKLEEIEEPDLYIDGTYYGAAFGYNDDILVEVLVTDGKIVSIKVVEHYDDQPYMKDAEKKVIPAIINKQTTNVDACSGATFSSNGIIEAVREALADAGTEANPDNSGDNPTVPPEGDIPDDTETPGETETPADPSIPGEGDDATEYVWKDGIYNNDDNMVLCENPRETSWAYYLSIQVTITDGKITAVSESKKEGKNGEYDYQNNSYLTRAFEGIGKRKGMAAKIIENQGTQGVDTVTGATVTSDAIIQAVDIILSTVEKVPVAEDVPDQNNPEDLLNPEDLIKPEDTKPEDTEDTNAGDTNEEEPEA